MLLSWGLGHQFPTSLLRKSNALKPDLPSHVFQGQVQPTWLNILENVGQLQEPFPEGLKERLSMHPPSLHLLPSTWLTACKLAATQKAEGKTHTFTLTRAHSYKPSCCKSLILISPNPAHQQSKYFFPIRRTSSPAKRQVVWQYETGCGCRLCTWLTFVPLVCGFQGATVVQ